MAGARTGVSGKGRGMRFNAGLASRRRCRWARTRARPASPTVVSGSWQTTWLSSARTARLASAATDSAMGGGRVRARSSSVPIEVARACGSRGASSPRRAAVISVSATKKPRRAATELSSRSICRLAAARAPAESGLMPPVPASAATSSIRRRMARSCCSTVGYIRPPWPRAGRGTRGPRAGRARRSGLRHTTVARSPA